MTSFIPNSGDGHIQFFRHWGSGGGLGTSTASGLMTPGTVYTDLGGFIRPPTFPAKETLIVQGAFRNLGLIAGPFTQEAGIVFYVGGTEQLRLIQVPLGASASGSRLDGAQYVWEVRRGATVLATSKPFWTFGWDVIQMKVFFNDPVLDPLNGSVEVRLSKSGDTNPDYPDGPQQTIINISGIDTSDSGFPDCDQVEFNYSVEQSGSVWDHILVMDTAGAVNNDFPAEPLILVHGMVPNSNGDLQEWTIQGGQCGSGNSYECVNDSSSSSADDVGRFTSETTGQRSIFGFQYPGTAGIVGSETGHPISLGNSVKCVMFHHVSGMESSGTRTVRPLYRDIADVDSEQADEIISGTTFQGYTTYYETNPITALAWTPQETIEMQWGLKLHA
jgi:hypothetical protein